MQLHNIINQKECTALIDKEGYIYWEFKYNHIPKQYLYSKEKVTEYLNSLGYDKFFNSITTDKLE